MTDFPTLGQKGPAQPWRDQLKAYIDETSATNFSEFIAKAETGFSDLSLLVIGDSTAAANGGWVDQLVPQLAARFPHLNISYAKWTDGTPGSYAAPTVTPGTGTRTLRIYNGAKAGESWQYHFESSRAGVMIVPTAADAVIVALGHNDNAVALGNGVTEPQRGKAIAFIETLRTMLPSARVVLTSQNPLISTAKSSENRADMLRTLARSRGYGFIDIAKAFYDDGRAMAGTLVSGDNVHPTVAGYKVWADRVFKEFLRPSASLGSAQASPAFSALGMNLIPDPTFAAYDGATAPAGWTLNRVDHSRVTAVGEFETGTGALRLVKNVASQAALAERQLPLPLVRGKTIVAAVRLAIPVNAAGSKVQVALRDNGGIVASEAHQMSVGQYHWRIITYRVPVNATAAYLRIVVDATTGTELNSILVDRVGVWVGDYPYEVAP